MKQGSRAGPMLRWPRRRWKTGSSRDGRFEGSKWVRMRRWWWDRWMDSNQWTVKKTERSGVSKKREWPATVAARGCNSRARRKKERVDGPRSREVREVREVKEKGQELQQQWAAVTLSLPSPFRAARGEAREVQRVCCAKNVAGPWQTIGKQRGPPGSTADQSSILQR